MQNQIFSICPTHHTVTTYNKISEVYSETFNKAAEHIDVFLDRLPSGGKVLDVGCGPGFDSGYMAARNFDVVGIDYSPKMIETARKMNSSVRFEVKDMRDLDFEAESFEGIFVSFSLIHIPKIDTYRTLRGFHSLLKPRGVVYLSIQEGPSQEIFVPTPLKPDETLFLNIISSSEIESLLQAAGFNLLKNFKRGPKVKELHFSKYFVLAEKATGIQ